MAKARGAHMKAMRRERNKAVGKQAGVIRRQLGLPPLQVQQDQPNQPSKN
ncbi:MAG: hypothetical protein ABI397_00130 [Candidatus Saccharimonas sp.]